MSALAFELPPALEAPGPPEARGVRRDQVRLLVGRRAGALSHHRFEELPGLLSSGDLLVVNTSATLPAALPGRRGNGSSVRLHVASRAPRLSASWRVVELRSADGARPTRAFAGESIALPGGAEAELMAPYTSGPRLMLARFRGPAAPVEDLLRRHGAPIRYGYSAGLWPLADYQTVFAAHPGSAEMPSAARPFTAALVTRLVTAGVAIAPITLHCSVSSPEHHEPPVPEYFRVPEATAAQVQATRRRGGRVVAVGTTVVRALESAARDGTVRARAGWTNLVIGPERGVSAFDGLITGWHEPEASHLRLLEAVAGRPLLERCYAEALSHGYLWHEFGDSNLILAPKLRPGR